VGRVELGFSTGFVLESVHVHPGPTDRRPPRFAALDAITDAVESGAGLPEIVPCCCSRLDASLVLTDRAGAVLAVAARSPADDAAARRRASRVEAIQLGGRCARGHAADARAGRAGAALVSS
jgi:hypothetical protein